LSRSTETGKKVVILIQGDPRKSHRPCEGIRIALGLAASGHQLEVILSDHAPLLLTGSPEKMLDGELITRFLETIKDFSHTFFTDRKRPDEPGSHRIIPLTKEMLAQKISESDCFLAF